MRLFPHLLRWGTARYNFSPGAETTWDRISGAECRSEGPQAGGVRIPGKDGGEMAPISALWRAA